MDPSGTLLFDLALVLGMAAVTTVLCRRLHQPAVLGYLVAGLIVGPYVPIPLFADAGRVATLSELGVILVMFGIGLEFSVGRLARVIPRTGIVAVLQLGTMLWLGYMGARALDWTRLEAMFTGAALCISSTMIVARVFADQATEKRLSELVFSVLVLQDFVAVVLMAVLTGMASGVATGAELPASQLALMVGKLAGFLVVMVAVGFLVVPRSVRAVARMRSPETLLVVCIGLCFALAELAYAAGFSVALGAFLAGTLVAESGEGHQVERLVRPVRDMFAAIFFVTVGMSVDPAGLGAAPGAIALFVVLVLVGQVLSLTLGGFLAGYGLRHAVMAGTSLAQVGEFGFIIVGIGTAAGVVRPELFGVVVAVSAVTSVATPWLVRAGGPLAAWIDRRLPHALQTHVSLYGTWIESLRSSEHHRSLGAIVRRSVLWLVLDASLLSGVIMAASLVRGTAEAWGSEALGAPAWAMDLALVGLAAALCAPFVAGVVRVSRHLGGVLARAALPLPAEGAADFSATPRRAYVVTFQLSVALMVLVPVAALTQPFVSVWGTAILVGAAVAWLGLSFWHGASELAQHARAGAEAIAEALSRHARGDEPAFDADATQLDFVQELLPGLGTLTDLEVGADSPVAGQSLAALNLRGLTGATIFAIQRGERRIVSPDARERLEPGDLLCAAGTRPALRLVRGMVEGRVLLEEDEGGPPLGAAAR